MTGWEKEERFEKWGGTGTLSKAMYTVVETDSFGTLTQEDLDGLAPDGEEYIDTKTVEGMERAMQMLSDGEMGGVRWYQEVPLPEAPRTPSPETSSGAIGAASQDYAIDMDEEEDEVMKEIEDLQGDPILPSPLIGLEGSSYAAANEEIGGIRGAGVATGDYKTTPTSNQETHSEDAGEATQESSQSWGMTQEEGQW